MLAYTSEMSLFVSYATNDASEKAQALVRALEASGQKCWIAPRDIRPGLSYPSEIMQAIKGASGVILFLSQGANESRDVLQEVQAAHDARKTIAPVDIFGGKLVDGLQYYLGDRHKISWTTAASVASELNRTFKPPYASAQVRLADPSEAGHEASPRTTGQVRLADPSEVGPEASPRTAGGFELDPRLFRLLGLEDTVLGKAVLDGKKKAK